MLTTSLLEPNQMRHFLSLSMLMASAAVIAQEDCDVFNIPDLAAEVLTQQAQIDSLSCLAGVEMDGYRYKGVFIGEQCWFAENLRTTVYADDSSIPEVTGSSDWGALSTGARCHYDNDPVVNYGYGLLYNWYAVDNASGLCPNGWHVPTDGEWTALEDYITAEGFNGTEGTALKSTSGWNNNGNGTDDFGFSALPGGYRNNLNGNFYDAGSLGLWWSSSSYGGDAWFRGVYSSGPGIGRNDFNPRYGFSVRCLRDAD